MIERGDKVKNCVNRVQRTVEIAEGFGMEIDYWNGWIV